MTRDPCPASCATAPPVRQALGVLGALVLLVALTVGATPAAPASAAVAGGSVVPCGLTLGQASRLGARLDDVTRQLDADPVLVEDGAVDLDDGQRDRLRTAVEEADSPVWVAALTGLPRAVDPTAVACTLANVASDPVSVVVLLGPDHLPVLGGDATLGAPRAADQRTYLAVQADLAETGAEADRLLLLVDRVSGVEPVPSDDGPTGGGTVTLDPSDTTRSGQGLVLALVAGALALVAVVLLLVVRRRRASGRRTRRLLGSVRHGRSTASAIATRRAVRELGDRLERLDLGPGDDAASWQRALDAYDAAARGLDRADGAHGADGADGADEVDLAQVRRHCVGGQEELDAIEAARVGRGRR